MSLQGNVIRVSPPRAGIPREREWHEIGDLTRPTLVREPMKRQRLFFQNLGRNIKYSVASHGWAILGGLIAGGILGGVIGVKLSGAKAATGIAGKVIKAIQK